MLYFWAWGREGVGYRILVLPSPSRRSVSPAAPFAPLPASVLQPSDQFGGNIGLKGAVVHGFYIDMFYDYRTREGPLLPEPLFITSFSSYHSLSSFPSVPIPCSSHPLSSLTLASPTQPFCILVPRPSCRSRCVWWWPHLRYVPQQSLQQWLRMSHVSTKSSTKAACVLRVRLPFRTLTASMPRLGAPPINARQRLTQHGAEDERGTHLSDLQAPVSQELKRDSGLEATSPWAV